MMIIHDLSTEIMPHWISISIHSFTNQQASNMCEYVPYKTLDIRSYCTLQYHLIWSLKQH